MNIASYHFEEIEGKTLLFNVFGDTLDRGQFKLSKDIILPFLISQKK